MITKFLLLLITALLSASAFAVTLNNQPVELSRIGFNAGSLTEFVGKVQTSSNGDTRTFELNPTIGASFLFPLPSKFEVIPEINWVLPRKTGTDKVYKNLFMFRADGAYRLWDWFRLRVGTSIMLLNTHGSGGKVSRDNGNGQTTFYRPDSNSSSFNNTFDLGAEFLLGDWGFRAQTFTYSLFNAERRQHSYLLMATYYWDHKK